MAVLHAGIECVVREVHLKDKPAEMLRISPKGTVPVLRLPDGEVIDESLDIMRWANTQHHGWLDSDVATSLIERNDSYFKFHLDRYKYPQRFQPQTDASFHREQADFFLAELEQSPSKTAYLYGAQPSVADVAIFPFVRQFAGVEPDHFATLALPYLQIWLKHWQKSELFGLVMRQYAQSRPGVAEQMLF